MSTFRTDTIAFDPGQVAHLLAQGAKGHHVLFDTHQIRRALSTYSSPDEHLETVDELRLVILELMQCDDIVEQRAVIYSLPLWLQDVTIRMYFYFLDRYLKGQSLTWH